VSETSALQAFIDAATAELANHAAAIKALQGATPVPVPVPVPVPPPAPLPGPAQRPAYNTGTGFFVLGKTLYDAAGYEFRIRGVNKAHYDQDHYTIAANMKANAVRWSMWDAVNTRSSQVTAANAWIAKKIVPIPGNWAATNLSSPADLTPIVDLWVAQAALWTAADLQRYAIISVANEWGPANSVIWRDSYITAISRLRAAGYKQTLMIDSGGSGQDAADLLQYAQAVFDSDPQKNIIFGLHIYGGWARPATQAWMQDYDTLLAQIAQLNVPVVIGEFGPGANIGPSPTPITPLEIMTTAESYKWGWMAWALDDNNLAGATSDDSWFAMLYNNFVYNSSADLTNFGKVVVDNPTYGLKALAVKATAFP
jgi:mannan endo-1,4-beta-mannosidase